MYGNGMRDFQAILAAQGVPVGNFLEIGSRDGNDAREFAEAAGIDKVFIIEPSPGSYREIVSAHPKFKVFRMALSNYEGTGRFFDVVEADLIKRGMSSLMSRDVYGNLRTNEIEVPVCTGASFLKTHGLEAVTACKIDVEGHAYEVLEGFGPDLSRLWSLHVECELVPVWDGQKLYRDVHALLEGAGFTRLHYWEFNDGVQCDSVWIQPSKAVAPPIWQALSNRVRKVFRRKHRAA
jgi:FkbM family methyltransferase